MQSDDLDGYAEMAEKMESLAASQPGYLGFESARSNLGIAVSYWKDEESIHAWKQDVEHQIAQNQGRQKWYACYKKQWKPSGKPGRFKLRRSSVVWDAMKPRQRLYLIIEGFGYAEVAQAR